MSGARDAGARAARPRLVRAVRSPLAWDLLLAVLCLGWSLLFIAMFAPGRVNVDIASQYSQAIGDIPVSDWHPPIMSAVWHVLIDLTGEKGSLLVLQVGLIALSCWILGVLVHRLGAPRWVSLLGPAVMVTPWTLSQMTTLWKDTQMAAALLAAVILLIVARLRPRAWVLWLPALALLVYAVGLRKNAVFAVVPIAVYLGWCLVSRLRARRTRRAGNPPTADAAGQLEESGQPAESGQPDPPAQTVQSERPVQPDRPERGPLRRGLRTASATAAASLAVLIVIAAGVKATDAIIASRTDVEATGQISQILLDDVMFSIPDEELMGSDAPRELTEHISSARTRCVEKKEIWDAYWNCYGLGESGEPFSPIAYQDELRQLWLDHVITHPVRYLEYRFAVFSHYFFTSSLEYWPWEWNGSALAAGIESGSDRADFIFRPYVEDFALATFPTLFKPWFWTALAVVLLVIAHRMRRNRATVDARLSTPTPADGRPGPGRTPRLGPEITMLATSALCYVVGYLPIIPSNHFRYTYWPAIAVTVGLVLALAARTAARHTRRHSASREA